MRGVLGTMALAVLLAGVPIMAADDLELSFHEGRVTVIATDVSVQTILQEWSRVGRTDFVDADKLTGPPVRLQLVGVPEADALRVLLRQAAGYVAAPRSTPPREGSRFDRVLVMASSRRPASSSYVASPGSAVPRPVPAQREPATSVPGFDGFDPGSMPEELDRDDLEELREILPQPFSLIERSNQDDQRTPPTSAPTASRPGIVVAPSDDEPAVFIRRPVRPQDPDDTRQ